jgi:phage gpG-like protein
MISIKNTESVEISVQPMSEYMLALKNHMETSVLNTYQKTHPNMKRSSPLFQSIRGYSGDDWAEIRAGEGGYPPYAMIQQKGGSTHPNVTTRSRKFFWMMFYATGDEKWKWMALSKKNKFTVSIQANPYMVITDEDWDFILNTLGSRRVSISTTFNAEVLPTLTIRGMME